MPRIAIIGSGPTGIYTLKGLIASSIPLSITVFEETPDAGKGTPYHPAVNDRAMLANIASIEIPPIEQSLVAWLQSRSDTRLQELGIERKAIGEREFYPRIVLGEYLAAQFWTLVNRGARAGHSIDVKASHKILDIDLNRADITLSYRRADGSKGEGVYDHVVMATGHDWPADTETSPGYFSSPWPAAAIKRIGPVKVGILGTSLSGIDAVVSVATAHGTFLRDQAGTLQYSPNPDSAGFCMTMMSRKGLLPEADFYCEMPYQALRACTEEAVKRLIAEKPERLLDEVFELFKQEIALADPEYAAAIGLSLATIEDIADRYFRACQTADPFVWAAFNLVEAKRNKVERRTVRWRYAILRMHEVVALAVPHFNDRDLKRFHQHFKTVFVDDYATVPHQSVERLLVLHNAAKLSVMTLGDDYEVERVDGKAGVVIAMKGRRSEFGAFIDAIGQHAMSVSDLPFPSLRRSDALQEAATRKAQSGDIRRTGGIDLDDDFRPHAANGMSNQLYCVSVPFLLHKLPFVQGITSAHEIGTKVASAIVSTIANAEHSLLGAFNQETTISSPTANEPSASDPA